MNTTDAQPSEPASFDTEKYFNEIDRRNEARAVNSPASLLEGEKALSDSRINKPLRVATGAEQRGSTGILGEAGLGVLRGTYGMVRGIAKTAEVLTWNEGPGTLSYGMDKMDQTNQDSFISAPEYKGVADWTAATLGEAVPTIASFIASGGVAGGIAKGLQLGVTGTKVMVHAGALATFMSTSYGDNVDGIKHAGGGRITDGEARAMAAMSGIIQYGLFTAVGPAKRILNTSSLLAMQNSSIPLSQLFEQAGKQGLFGYGAKAIGAETLAFSGSMALQSLTQSAWEAVAAGPDGPGMTEEDFKQAFHSALAAIPLSVVFGGMATRAEWRVRQGILDVQKGLEASKEAVGMKYATPEDAQAAMLATDEAFTKFGQVLGDRFGPNGGKNISDIMKVQAYHWAAETGNSPETYIKDFQNILFSNTTLNEQQINHLHSLETPEQQVAWMRENVQGYRAFEARNRETYLTSAIEQQYVDELQNFRNSFGKDFARDLDLKQKTAEADIVISRQEADQKQAPTAQEQAQRAMERRTTALKNLYELRQEALRAVDDVKITDSNAYVQLASITRQTASDMFRSLYDPGENKAWITPENMRRTLADLLYINRRVLSREEAYNIVSKLGERRIQPGDSELTGKGRQASLSELEAAFMLEATKGEQTTMTIDGKEVNVGHYNVDEMANALRVLKGNDAMWQQIASQERSFAQYQDILDAAIEAGASEVQRAQIVLNQAADIFSRSRMGKNIPPDISTSVESIQTLAGSLSKTIQERGGKGVIESMTDALNKNINDLMAVVDQRKGEERRLFHELRNMPDLLESSEGKKLYAQYDPKAKWAVFYANATAEDVFHEWFHHVDSSGLLPTEYRKAMDLTYGITNESTPSQKRTAMEKAARDFVQYLNSVSKTVAAGGMPANYPPQMKDAFEYLRGVFAAEFHATEGIPESGSLDSGSTGNVRTLADIKDLKIVSAETYPTAVSVLTDAIERSVLEGNKEHQGLMHDMKAGKFKAAPKQWALGMKDRVVYTKPYQTGKDFEITVPGFEGRMTGTVYVLKNPDMKLASVVANDGTPHLVPFDAIVVSVNGNLLYSDSNIQYKPEVRDFMKGAFENVTIDTQKEQAAKILEMQMNREPANVEQYQPGGLMESSSMANVEDVKTLRDAAHLMNVGGVKKGDGKTTHGAFFEKTVSKILGKTEYDSGDWESLPLPQKREVAQRAVDAKAKLTGRYSKEQLDEIAQAYEYDNWNSVPEGEKHRIRVDIASQKRAVDDKRLDEVMAAAKREELDRLAQEAVNEFLPYAEEQAGINPTIRESNLGPEIVSRKDRLLSDIPAKFKRFGAWIQSKTNDYYAMIDYIADGQKDSGWHKLLIDPMKKMLHEWGKARYESEGWLVEGTEKHGAHPIGSEWGKVYKFGNERVELSMREAVYIYMYTDRGRASSEMKALFGSNKIKLGNDPQSVIRDVITLVDGGANGSNKAYTKYVKRVGPNDYRYSDTPKEGFVKTFPLKNWAKTQMDYMKRIYPLLDAAHFERTGKHLGNLFVDSNGKQHEFIAPSMRIGQAWKRGSGLTDLFVVDEVARETLVKNMFSGEYGPDVTLDKLNPEDRQKVFEQEDILHSNERGLNARKQGDGRSHTVGSTESRTRGLVGGELMMDAPYIFSQYQEQADIYRTKYKTLDYLDNITRNPQFENALRRAVGNDSVDIVHKTIREMIDRERFPGGRNFVDSDYDRWVRHVQGRVMPAILGARGSSMAMQTASGPRALAEIPLRDAPKFLFNAAKVMKQIGGNTHRLIDAMMMRDNLLTGDTEVGRWFQHMLESSPEVVRRMIGPDVMDFYASAQKGTGMANMKVGRGTLTDVQMGGFRVMDMSTVLTVYHTAYESKVAELRRSSVNGGRRMTDAQIEKAATDFAEHVVNITQPASTIADRNLLQTSRPTVRMWFPFTGDRMKQFTYINRQVVAPIARALRAGNGIGKFSEVTKALFTTKYSEQPAAKRIALMGLLPMTMVSLIKRRRLPADWEEWREDMLGLSVSTLPLIGPIFQNALTSNYQIDGTPVAFMPVMALAKALRSAKQDGMLDENGLPNYYALEQLARSGATHEGLPVVTIDFFKGLGELMLGSEAFGEEDKPKIKLFTEMFSVPVAPAPDRTKE